MLVDNLLDCVLIRPAVDLGADELLVLSGYATANMATQHRKQLLKADCDVKVDLIVGMTPASGINVTHHHDFKKLSAEEWFDCQYVKKNQKACHAKIYVWRKDGEAVVAYCGSANYSSTAFSNYRQEAMSQVDAEVALAMFQRYDKLSVRCTWKAAKGMVTYPRKRKSIKDEQEEQMEKVRLSLLDKKTGKPHKRAGINWGQRPGRDPNQAYVPIPADLKSFFPPIGVTFTVRTDDNQVFVMVKAQMGGKALHTPHDNSQLGLYLRERLGVASGAFVELEHLLEYGRTDVAFTKVDGETYEMDFSRPSDS